MIIHSHKQVLPLIMICFSFFSSLQLVFSLDLLYLSLIKKLSFNLKILLKLNILLLEYYLITFPLNGQVYIICPIDNKFNGLF